MYAYEYFYLVTQSKVDDYQLLSSLWQTMVPEEKSKALYVLHSHDFMWTTSCVMDLRNNFHLTLKEVVLLQVFIWLALYHPSNLDRGIEYVLI